MINFSGYARSGEAMTMINILDSRLRGNDKKKNEIAALPTVARNDE